MTHNALKRLRVPERMTRLPQTVSEAARANLAAMIDENAMPVGAMRDYPDNGDMNAWKIYRNQGDERIMTMMRARGVDLKSEIETTTIAGVTVHVAMPPECVREDCAYIDVHGGGLILGSGEMCRTNAGLQADRHQVRTFGIDYRVPPEHPYPAALDDCIAVYRTLLERYSPEKIAVGGASAGGNLAAALALRARDEGLPLPAALVLLTPEVDLTESGDTFETNAIFDVVLPTPLMPVNLLYANGCDLAHPYLSPLFGDFRKGFPPTFLQSGTRDLFLSNTVRMHRALLEAGVAVELHVFEGMPHGGFGGAPEDAELAAETQKFVYSHWP